MPTEEGLADRRLGGRAALLAYRAERAAARMRLRDELRAGHAALRATRTPDRPAAPPLGQAPATEPENAFEQPVPTEEHSVFAELIGSPVAATQQPDAIAAAAASPEPMPEPDALPVTAAEPVAFSAMDPPDSALPPASPCPTDLSAIAELGPGMRLRLRQLGIATLDDLARADANWLREGLGEISRLLRVERWIETARDLRTAA